MTKIIKIYLFCILSLLFLCKQSVGMAVDTPIIVAGTSKITGKIISPNDTQKNKVFVNITVTHPISGEYVKYKAFVDRSGKFSIDVDVETDISLIGLYTSLNIEKTLLFKLISGGVTNVDIAYNSNNDIENIDVAPAMNQYDMTQGLEVMNND